MSCQNRVRRNSYVYLRRERIRVGRGILRTAHKFRTEYLWGGELISTPPRTLGGSGTAPMWRWPADHSVREVKLKRD